jgi:hypothetical protein
MAVVHHAEVDAMTTGTPTTSAPGTPARSLDARRCAGLSGFAVAVLFAGGNALWALNWPKAGARAAEIADFYRDTSDRIVVGASLSLLTIAAAVLFSAAFRRVLTEAEGDDLLATTAFGGALLGLAAGVGAETINMVGALRARDGQLSAALAQSVWEIARVLGSTAAGVGMGIFALATAAVALRTGVVLPRWLAIVTAVVGTSLLTPVSYVGLVTGGALVLFVLAISVVLLRTPIEVAPHVKGSPSSE